MSGGQPLHDRVTGRLVPVGDGPVLLGRFVLPDTSSGRRLGDRLLSAGDYLAGPDRFGLVWSDHTADRVTVDFGPRPLPQPLLRENVMSTAARLDKLRAAGAPMTELLAVPALVADADQRLGAHPLEDSMRDHMPFLRVVCRTPHARLRTDHVLDSVSRTRRITWHTIQHLARSSETWAARTLHGVEPARLLTPTQVPDFDLYENRVVATLVDRLWRHVLARTDELNEIDRWLRRGRQFLEAARTRPSWRERMRLYDALAPVLAEQEIDERVAELRESLDVLQLRLVQLRRSPLYTEVRAPYTGPARLRPTNLFLDNGNYRRCGMLWDAWAQSHHGDEQPESGEGGLTPWCRSFAAYVELLLLRAINQLGLQPALVADGIQFVHRGAPVTVERGHDDTFVVRRNGQQVLRIVPLPHALTAPYEPAEVVEALLQLAGSSSRTAIVYPAQPHDRDRLPLAVRLAVSDVTGADLAGQRLPPLVPVGPSDIDSTGRAARMLRTALDTPALLDYPVSVPCPTLVAAVLAHRIPWVTTGLQELRVFRLPGANELTALPVTVAEAFRELPKPHRHAERGSADLAADLRAAVDRLRLLTVCPVCRQQPELPERVFEPRAGETYRAECLQSSCRSAWELRRCASSSCSQRFAVLIAGGLATEVGGHGDHLDRTFSQDLLASPCWVNPRAYLCPDCRRCPEADADGVRPECTRCSSLGA